MRGGLGIGRLYAKYDAQYRVATSAIATCGVRNKRGDTEGEA
jgi:hypothetical protein